MSYSLEDLKIDLLSSYKVSDFIEINKIIELIETKQENKLEFKDSLELIKAFKKEVIKDNINQKKNFKNALEKFNFKYLTKGSSRKVYVNREYNLVIKESFNSKGIHQNNEEVSLSNDYYGSTLPINVCLDYLETNQVFLTFYDYCQPLKAKWFKEKYKYNLSQFMDCIDYFIKDKVLNQKVKTPLLIKEYSNEKFSENNSLLNELIYDFEQLIGSCELTDIYLKQFGVNNNDNVVLIDYGLNNKDFKELYKKQA